MPKLQRAKTVACGLLRWDRCCIIVVSHWSKPAGQNMASLLVVVGFRTSHSMPKEESHVIFSKNLPLNRASGFRLLSLQSEPRSAVRYASDVSTDATLGDCVPTPPRPIPYGRGPVHGPKTAASRDVLSSPRTPTRSSASAAGRPLWRLWSPSRLDAQG